jgi:hypothetical protein
MVINAFRIDFSLLERFRRRIIQVSMRLFVAVLFLFACAPRESTPPPAPPKPRPVIVTSEEFRGLYIVGDERSAFEPCGKTEAWWIDFSPEARETLREYKVSGWGHWPMRVRGTLSPKGRYGHLGMYPRQLNVEQVIAAGRREGC